MTQALTVSSLVVARALAVAEAAGVPGEVLRAIPGLNSEAALKPDARLPAALYQRLLAEVAYRTGNEFFWLQESGPEVFSANNPLWYIVFSSGTLRQALERAEAMYTFYSDAHYPSMHVTGTEFSVRLSVRAPGYFLSGHSVDWLLASWWCIGRALTGTRLRLRSVRLASAYSGRQWVYRKFFGVPVAVDQPHNELVFDACDLELPNVCKEADPDLEKLMLRYVQEVVQAPRPKGGFEESLRAVLQQQLPHGTPELKAVAEHLAMSARTLQRKLGETGSSFSGEIHKVRQAMASAYLRESDLAIGEIARRVGFRDSASLTTAFRKWFGTTPTEYRNWHMENAQAETEQW